MELSSEYFYPLTPEASDYDAIESLLNETNFKESDEITSWMNNDVKLSSLAPDENDEVISNFSSTYTNSRPASPLQNQENPLSLPENAYQLSDSELRDLPVRKLNELLRKLPKDKAKTLRKRRRCLKNRNYAQDCRARRAQCKTDLEDKVKRLIKELSRMRKELDDTKKERDHFKVLLQSNQRPPARADSKPK